MNAREIKNIDETIALSAAGIFFFYKFISGYLFINLTIKIDCDRKLSEIPGQDRLVIKVALSKGDRGSLELHDASVNIEYEGDQKQNELLGFRRSSYEPRPGIEENRFKRVTWERQSKKSPFLRLTPGEELQLAATCLVPSDKWCNVQAVILGKRSKGWKFGQWKAALISLPIGKT